jgi:hypothetical protein
MHVPAQVPLQQSLSMKQVAANGRQQVPVLLSQSSCWLWVSLQHCEMSEHESPNEPHVQTFALHV